MLNFVIIQGHFFFNTEKNKNTVIQDKMNIYVIISLHKHYLSYLFVTYMYV